MKKLKQIIQKLLELRKAECNLLIVLRQFLYYYLLFEKRKIIAHQNTLIRGIKRIKMQGLNSLLYIGTSYRGFLYPWEWSLINVEPGGTLIIHGRVFLARGIKIIVCKGGVLELGDKVSINSYTEIICKNHIVIGKGTMIGWKCNFLDDDFHESGFMGRTSTTGSPIILGEDVWIASYVSFCKGVRIADRCTIQQYSVVDRSFTEPNATVLIRIKPEFLVCKGKTEKNDN
jgi:acetyltransferase-like isoleucine patch superfamily enzyme